MELHFPLIQILMITVHPQRYKFQEIKETFSRQNFIQQPKLPMSSMLTVKLQTRLSNTVAIFLAEIVTLVYITTGAHNGLFQ